MKRILALGLFVLPLTFLPSCSSIKSFKAGSISISLRVGLLRPQDTGGFPLVDFSMGLEQPDVQYEPEAEDKAEE